MGVDPEEYGQGNLMEFNDIIPRIGWCEHFYRKIEGKNM